MRGSRLLIQFSEAQILAGAPARVLEAQKGVSFAPLDAAPLTVTPLPEQEPEPQPAYADEELL